MPNPSLAVRWPGWGDVSTEACSTCGERAAKLLPIQLPALQELGVIALTLCVFYDLEIYVGAGKAGSVFTVAADNLAVRFGSGYVYVDVYSTVLNGLNVTLGAYQFHNLVDCFSSMISFEAAEIAAFQLGQASDTGDYGGFTNTLRMSQGIEAVKKRFTCLQAVVYDTGCPGVQIPCNHASSR